VQHQQGQQQHAQEAEEVARAAVEEAQHGVALGVLEEHLQPAAGRERADQHREQGEHAAERTRARVHRARLARWSKRNVSSSPRTNAPGS